MASSPPPTRSAEDVNADMRHPMPDLQSLQGAYVGNIERLEEHAERMSEPGSDLGEEIRKLHSELKLTDSRRSSLRSTQLVDEPPRLNTTRSRNVSTSSHANSIVDLNGNARWGGYSPGGYIGVTSPVGSLGSGSFSNPPTSMQRQRSGSKASRLGQVVHPDQVDEEREKLAAYPASPQSARSAPLAAPETDSPPPPEQRRVSSFTRIYDEVASGLPEELRNSVIKAHTPPHTEHHQPEETYDHYAGHHNLPDRPPTAASTDTTHQARILWHDFDGVHCPDTVIEEEPTPSLGGHSRHSSNLSAMMKSNPGLPVTAAPPPDDSMVFYPAPVPKMLSLPKRLSQLPATDVKTKRRTKILESMQLENRKSAPLLGEMTDLPKPSKKKNRQTLMSLPPQLRASAYFDPQAAPPQEFAVKGESAGATLDSILDASARAPVSAFTDHPYAGRVGNEVYGQEHNRKSSNFLEPPPKLDQKKRRSSFNMLDTKRNSSGDLLNKLKKRNSSADMNLLTVKASESRMSLGDDLSERDQPAGDPQIENAPKLARLSFEDQYNQDTEGVYEDEVLKPEEEEQEEQEEPDEPFYGAPTTLLAELQLRKAKQKTRNLNYATLVEQGLMPQHRTLLQMDEQAEKEKQKRLRKKVHLAWEAQGEDDDSDDDVPLGVLYKKPDGQQKQDWNQPLGLIAQRELEDQEPLSRRRNRLRGEPRDLSPHKRGTQYHGASSSQANLAVPITLTPGPDSEEDGETLGERKRRLKEKQMLSAALGGNARDSTISGDFAAEMMNKFGGSEGGEKAQAPPKPTPSPGPDEEEETLGQRRARLQAEAAARGQVPPTGPRPALRSATSLAELLSANPMDNTNQARKISNELLVSHLPQGSLLRQNEMAEERKKAQRVTYTNRASSYGYSDPLFGNVANKNDDDQPLGMKIQAYKNKMAGVNTPPVNAPVPNMMFNNQIMGPTNMPGMMPMNPLPPNMMQQQQNPQMMNMGMLPPMQPGFQYPQTNPGMMRPQSMMNMPMGMPMNGMGMQMGPMPMGPMQMNAMGMPLNAMGMPQMMGPPMDPRQRDQIDQWMQGVRH